MPEHTANRKLIILDPSLKDTGGHFYEYDVAIAAAALRQARYTWIYANKSCHTGLTIPGGEIDPWFTTEWSAAGGRIKTSIRFILNIFPAAVRIPLLQLGRFVWTLTKNKSQRTINLESAKVSNAAAAFGKEVTEALHHAGCNGDDIIFLPTIRTSELFALWTTVKNNTELSDLQFHIVLRRDAAEMDFPEDGAPGISFLFRELHAMPGGNGFRFYCDTQQLCDDYSRLSSNKLKFRILPIPFPIANPDPTSLIQWTSSPAIKLVYLGGARTEKGFHLLSRAENILRENYPGTLLWRLQAPKGGPLEEPEVIAARQKLLSVRDGSVELIERNLSSAEFHSLLLSADIILLPYLREFYRSRSSGILVQVLAAGKPVIVPAGTWLSSQTNGVGAVEFESPVDFPAALLKAIQQLPRLSQEARDRSVAYAALHSADSLLAGLESGAGDNPLS